MSERSDWIKHVHEPEVASLRATIKGLREQRDFEAERANRLAAFVRERGQSREYGAYEEGALTDHTGSEPASTGRNHNPPPPLGGEWVTVPREPGTCEGDDSGHVLAFLHALHSHLPEDERPTSWMSFSDDQRERIQAAYRAMIAASPPSSQIQGGGETSGERPELPCGDPIKGRPDSQHSDGGES